MGWAGSCRLRIPEFAELACPLYEATCVGKAPLEWTEQMGEAFGKVKAVLLEAPVLALPGVTKPFHLYMDEKKGVPKRVLTHCPGPGKDQWPICQNDWTQW